MTSSRYSVGAPRVLTRIRADARRVARPVIALRAPIISFLYLLCIIIVFVRVLRRSIIIAMFTKTQICHFGWTQYTDDRAPKIQYTVLYTTTKSHIHQARCPPSTMILWGRFGRLYNIRLGLEITHSLPVQNVEPSPASQRATPRSSCGIPKRPSGF